MVCDKMLGRDGLGAPNETIGTCYPIEEHSVLPHNVKWNVFWANNVRPYGYISANGLQRCAESAHPTVERMQYQKHSETTEMIPQ